MIDMSIIASTPSILQASSCAAPTQFGKEFRDAFYSYLQARQAGFISKTAWAKKDRTIKPNQLPSIVVRTSGKVGDGVSSWECALEDLGDGFFIAAFDFYEVYSIEQTVPKVARRKEASPPTRQSAFYIPMNFDSTLFSDKQRDFVHYFLNLLHWKWICWQADERTGFIPLKHDYLTKVIPKEMWQDIRSRLVALGVIDWDERYCPNSKSYGYRLCPGFRKTRRIVCANNALNRKIQTVYAEENTSLLPIHKWLSKKFDLLDFDMELAGSIIPTMRPHEKRKKKDADVMPVEEYRLLVTELCQRFVEGEFFLTCDKYGRVHTPITSLPKELRSCLLIDGQTLVGLDLANSQPLIAGICAKQFFKSRHAKCRLLKRTFDEGRNPYCYREMQEMAKKVEAIVGKSNQLTQSEFNNIPTNSPLTPRITTEEKSEVIVPQDTYDSAQLQHSAVKQEEYPDLHEYIELCENGQFYESLMESGEDRRAFKEKFYGDVFFGKNCYDSKLKDRFERQFPSMAKMLKEVKKSNYRHSSWLMQNYEATIFIYTICKRIKNERPELPVFTIHDSILTLPDSVEYVESVIMDEFRKLGIKPTLTKENYGESKQYAESAVA